VRIRRKDELKVSCDIRKINYSEKTNMLVENELTVKINIWNFLDEYIIMVGTVGGTFSHLGRICMTTKV